jgi:hypothetical protein
MKARPKNLDQRYGWCGKKYHGVFYERTEECPICREQDRRKKNRQCCARLYHGPGHQSGTYCQRVGKHNIHECTYGEFNQFARWKGPEWKIKFTGYFDDPPEV